MEPLLLDAQDDRDDARHAAAGALLVPLVRRRWVVLAAVVAGLSLGLALGVVQPNTYRSTGKLLVRWGAREEITPEAVIVKGSAGATPPRDVVNDELQLLRNPQVFESVAHAVTPERIFAPYDPTAGYGAETPPLYKRLFHRLQSWWFHDSEPARASGHEIDGCDWCVTLAADVLMQDMSVGAEPYTSVITVSYAAHDPRLASLVVGSFLDAAEQRHHEVYSANPTLDFLSQRVSASRSEMLDAEKAFNDLRLEHGVSDYDARRGELIAAVRELEQQAAEDATSQADLESRVASLAALLAEVPPTTVQKVDRAPYVNPKWQSLWQQQVDLEAALDELAAQVGGTTDRKEIERASLEKRLADVIAKLEHEPDSIERTMVEQSVANPRYMHLLQQHDDLVAERSALEKVAALRAGRLEQARKDLKAVEQCGPLYHELEAKAAAARARYADFEEAHRRTSLIKLLDSMDYSNLRRIQAATVPIEKEGPRRGKLVFVGLLLGIFAGCALAFVSHAFDPYVRSPADVERLLGMKLVGVVPRSRQPRPSKRIERAAL